MIQYIYFVKCPNCEDEAFDFFDDAKSFATGCLSKQPIITQVEVCRNDFGECTDSNDLGTVWSWEDCMSDIPEESELSILAKADTIGYDPDNDTEFNNLDNTLDSVPDNFRKTVPADMTIKDLVEAMEENEDMVECTWCEDLFDKSECRYEVNLGWLCSRCEAAIKSRGETLTFRENNYWDFLDEEISEDTLNQNSKAPMFDRKKKVDLEYHDLEVDFSRQIAADDWTDECYTIEYTYSVPQGEVADTIWEEFLTEEDVVDAPGDLDYLYEHDDAWQSFLSTHFDSLFKKYYNEILDHFRESAESEVQSDYHNWDAYCDAHYDWDSEPGGADNPY